MARYESLAGGAGRSVFFRAPRLAADPLPGEDLLEVTLAGTAVRINDYSLSGMSSIDPNGGEEWAARVGKITRLTIGLPDLLLFEGSVRISRTDLTNGICLIGCEYLSETPDLPSIMSRQAQAHLERMATRSPSLVTDAVPAAYRALCADVLHLLSWQDEQLETYRAQLGDAATPEVMEAACQVIEAPMLAEWRQLWQRGEEIVGEMDPESPTFLATKRYTEQILTPAFRAGPIWDRSYDKPLGYPGDYNIMKMVYAWAREGDTPQARLIHRIGLEVAECIATRMVLVQQAIAATIEQFGNPGPARITSLGCGPAKEIENVLSASRLGGHAVFTLIDQDLGALEDTYARLAPRVRQLGEQAQLNILHESFLRVVRGGIAAEKIANQNLIYTVGLVDYLSAPMARSMVLRLYRRLAPGGLLMVGNMASSSPSNYWPMEFIADWRVKYRSREEMTAMAGLCKDSTVEVKRDSTGRVWMLYVRKPD